MRLRGKIRCSVAQWLAGWATVRLVNDCHSGVSPVNNCDSDPGSNPARAEYRLAFSFWVIA